MLAQWMLENRIEILGAVAGIIYVILEIRQNVWLWPVGIVTSAFYILVFYTSRFYADMSLQVYYLAVSCAGWYWWLKGTGHRAQSAGHVEEGTGRRAQSAGQEERLNVTRIRLKMGIVLAGVFVVLYCIMWMVLSRLTDSPVPEWDSFITSLSIVATWMLARKIYEHWFLWIAVNLASAVIFLSRGLYPTMVLYLIYLIMSFAGLKAWRSSITGS
jgi:nicotinamide mononucleotide transporter